MVPVSSPPISELKTIRPITKFKHEIVKVDRLINEEPFPGNSLPGVQRGREQTIEKTDE